MHIVNSELAGADVATIPFKVIQQLVHHPLTDKGLEAFLSDWKKRRGASWTDSRVPVNCPLSHCPSQLMKVGGTPRNC